jgi:hypothetical protein
MRKSAECTWIDYKANTENAKKINITPILDRIWEYRRNWF